MNNAVLLGALCMLCAACGHGPVPNVRSADAYERYLGAIEIAQNRERTGYFVLQKMLKDKDAMARTGAVISIAALMRQAASRDLIPMLADPDPDVRQETLRWLSKVEAVEAIPAMMKSLASDAQPEVRRTAAISLSPFADRDNVVTALVAALDDKAVPVAYNAWRTLSLAVGNDALPRERAAADEWIRQNRPEIP